jgi:hypothetical protein
MNRIERRLRDMINPYSTTFATWWCHSARYWRLPHMITGSKTAARPGLPKPAVSRVVDGASEGSGFSVLSVLPQAPNPGDRAAVDSAAEAIFGRGHAGVNRAP